MKLITSAFITALAARRVACHATFQDLWINGVDYGAQCVRLPPSNSPVTDTTSDDIRCNVDGETGMDGICLVAAGDTVTIEMHQVRKANKPPTALFSLTRKREKGEENPS